jgi:hypothetical protein
VNDVETSGYLLSSAPRNISSWRETHASLTHEVIALPDDSPSKVSRLSINALADRISPALIKTLAQRRQKAVHLTKRAGRLLKASMKSVQQRWAAHVYEIRP